MGESKWGRQTRGALRASNSDNAQPAEPDTLKTVVMKKEDIGDPGTVLAPDFRLALSVLAVGLQLWKVLNWTTLGIVVTFIGGFLTMQTARLRFRFTSSTIDVLRVQGLSDRGDEDKQKDDIGVGGEGGAIRGKSRAIGPWSYSSIVNWDFFWPGFPVLAYFKETQGKEAGQRHFMPIIVDGKALYQQMLLKFGTSLTPKPSSDEWQELLPLHPRGYAHYKQRLLVRWRLVATKLKLKEKLQLVEGMMDPAKREETVEKIKVLLMSLKEWAEKTFQGLSTTVKKKMDTKNVSK